MARHTQHERRQLQLQQYKWPSMQLLLLAVVLAQALISPVAAARSLTWTAPAPSISPSLEYYVQVVVGTPYTGTMVEALNSATTNNFGDMEAFCFNVTQGTSNSSKLLGNVRGYTVQLSYTTTSHEVEVEVISYDDGAGLSGTISLQGLINLATNELAIVGGSGSFRGVRGYAVISMVETNLYHHSLYFLP